MILQSMLPILLLVLLSACGAGKQELPPQDRNGSCYADSDCLEGLTCEGATRKEPGTCQHICKSDGDCGNGALCRSGQCQRDCADVGEKCSEKRVCCFFDENGDQKTDSHCGPDAAGDDRCAIVTPPLEEAPEGVLEKVAE